MTGWTAFYTDVFNTMETYPAIILLLAAHAKLSIRIADRKFVGTVRIRLTLTASALG